MAEATLFDSEEDKPVATLAFFENAHDGPGWYYWDDEYRDEGSVGAFETRAEAVEHATEAGYRFEKEAAS